MPSAGEVEQFAYCAQNWWLARRGVDPGGRGSERGIRQHRRLGAAHAAAGAELQESRFALKWMTLVLAMAGSATLLTLEVVVVGDAAHQWILVTLGLFLVGASASLLVLGLLARRRADRAVRAHGLAAESLAASGAAGSGPLLEWGDLRGTPDYIIESREGLVPVEVKTGRTPHSPHRSHVLQLACYLRLLEATRGTPPPYGLLQYPNGVFRIDWSPTLQQDLDDVLGRMAKATQEGLADRDHEHVARCRGCARRAGCSQSLA